MFEFLAEVCKVIVAINRRQKLNVRLVFCFGEFCENVVEANDLDVLKGAYTDLVPEEALQAPLTDFQLIANNFDGRASPGFKNDFKRVVNECGCNIFSFDLLAKKGNHTIESIID